jgi:hypothetical protein
MVEGTAVVGSPEEMNCSTAICAVASCIATRSVRAHAWQRMSENRSPVVMGCCAPPLG